MDKVWAGRVNSLRFQHIVGGDLFQSKTETVSTGLNRRSRFYSEHQNKQSRKRRQGNRALTISVPRTRVGVTILPGGFSTVAHTERHTRGFRDHREERGDKTYTYLTFVEKSLIRWPTNFFNSEFNRRGYFFRFLTEHTDWKVNGSVE